MDKKQIQKRRMMGYFISAALRIIEEEGLEAVTVRKVADYAGYNSATLYNYFDNLNHLLFFSSMNYLKDYVIALPKYLEGSKDPIDKYLRIWRCFCDYSFINPRIYQSIFFNNHNYSIKDAVKQYYSIFPEELSDQPEFLIKMLMEGDIYYRNIQLLRSIEDDGFISTDNIDKINEMTLLIYQGMLFDIISKEQFSIAEAIDRTLFYIKATLKAFRVGNNIK